MKESIPRQAIHIMLETWDIVIFEQSTMQLQQLVRIIDKWTTVPYGSCPRKTFIHTHIIRTIRNNTVAINDDHSWSLNSCEVTYTHIHIHCLPVAITTPEGGLWGYLSLQITHPAQERLAKPPRSTFEKCYWRAGNLRPTRNRWAKVLWDGTPVFSNLSEKTRKCSRLQMLFQRQYPPPTREYNLRPLFSSQDL